MLFLSTALPVSADAADYTTKQYNVSVNVNKDNSAYITETIHVDIHNPIHGIYRYIPLSQTVQYQDSKGNNIKTTRFPMKVQDISVGNEEKKLSREKGNQVIRIGNANKTVQGDKTYVLSYKSRMYDDGIHDYDSFFYTVLPYDWETAVQSSTINITMPAKFNPKELDVYAGPKGRKTNTGDIRTSVHGNTITIHTADQIGRASCRERV